MKRCTLFVLMEGIQNEDGARRVLEYHKLDVPMPLENPNIGMKISLFPDNDHWLSINEVVMNIYDSSVDIHCSAKDIPDGELNEALNFFGTEDWTKSVDLS